jgi:hypothetical protein
VVRRGACPWRQSTLSKDAFARVKIWIAERVHFVNGVGFERGIVTITAPAGQVITDFLGGGQELFLDDICYHW